MKLRYRLPAIGLAATLLLTPAAQALTPAETLSLLENYYLDSIPEQVYELTDVKEMIQALGDPYTQYFTAEEYEAFRASLSDSELVGAGISLKVVDNGVLVTRVMSGSAAAEAGMLPGDVITAIDGQSVAGMSQEQASDLLSGEEGSSFQVTYLRDGQSTTVTLTRRTFVVPAAFSELREDHIGYITCLTFGPDTAGHVLDGLETNAGQADHWLMDLRSNGGGEISAALETISYFIGPGDELVYMLTGDGSLVAQGSGHRQTSHRSHRRLYGQRLRAVLLRHPGHRLRPGGGRTYLRQGRGPGAAGQRGTSRPLPQWRRPQADHLSFLWPRRHQP